MSADSHVESDELDPDEPRTPMWLPLLGGALFLVAFMLFLVTRSDDDQSEEASGPEVAAEPTPGDVDAPQDDQAEDPAPARPRPGAAAAAAVPPPAARPPAAPQPAGGEPDAFQRKPGDEHYGHDHP